MAKIKTENQNPRPFQNPVDFFYENFDFVRVLNFIRVKDNPRFIIESNTEAVDLIGKDERGQIKNDEVNLRYDPKTRIVACLTTPSNLLNPKDEVTLFELFTILKFNGCPDSAMRYIELYHTKKEMPFIRIATDYYKIFYKKNRYGIQTKVVKGWKKDTIRDDFGKDFISKIPTFNDFTIEPNNIDYSPVISGGFYNLYAEFPHTPELSKSAKQFPYIDSLMKHIFGNQYELGLKYIKLMYEFPRQALPVLVLTSRERQTGKTTFLNLLNMMFGDNYILISPHDLSNSFNDIYATKNIIGIDETVIEKQNTVEKLKSIATQKTMTVNPKYVAHYTVPFFGKVIIATNRETDFMRIDDEEIRFWVRKVPSIKEVRPDIEEQMAKEIPYFLGYLSQLPEIDMTKSRMVFTADEIKTEFLEVVKSESQSSLYKELYFYIQDFFMNNEGVDNFMATPKDIKIHWFDRTTNWSINYISKVIKEEYQMTEEKQQRYLPFATSLNQLGGERKNGKPFLFLRSNFVTESVIEAEKSQKSNDIEEDLF